MPVLSPVFNIPKFPLDYYGLLTAYPGFSFFRGPVKPFPDVWSSAGEKVEKVFSRRSYRSSKLVLQVGPSDLPVEMSSYLFLRPLLTDVTVFTLWRHIIDKLGYSSHEQPTVHLDRGQAATAKTLAHTLWYQASAQVLSASSSPCRLRGRAGDRPFMVVFRGEGATDFGGPFQEFLSGVASEVMGTLSGAPEENLPPFLACLPCLNSTHAIGPYQDSVVLRPDVSEPYPDQLVTAKDLQYHEALSERRSCSSPPAQGPTRSAEDRQQEPDWAFSNHAPGKSLVVVDSRRVSVEEAAAQLFSKQRNRPGLLQSQFGRILQPETLWDPSTISSALPFASGRRGFGEEPGSLIMDRTLQEEYFGFRPFGREYSSLVSSNNASSGAPNEEEPLTEEAMYLVMYEALGRLMAMCFCIGSAFNITLNPLVWKKLVAMPLSIDVRDILQCVALS